MPFINETVEELRSVFDAWKQEIMDQISEVTPGEASTIIAAKVNGFTFDQMLAILVSEIATHASNPAAHPLTLQDVGGMLSVEFDSKASGKYPRKGMPVSYIPHHTPSLYGDALRFPSLSMTYLGVQYTLPLAEVVIPGNGIYYISLKAVGNVGQRRFVYSFSDSVQESLTEVVIGRVRKDGFGFAYSSREVRRIGSYSVEETPVGMAIPGSIGGVLFGGVVDERWFYKPESLPETALVNQFDEPLVNESGEILTLGFL